MFRCSISIKLRPTADSWWEQKGTVSVKYRQGDKLYELIEFDPAKGHFPNPRGGFKLVRWPDVNLLVDDYSHIGVIFNNRAVQSAMERILVATVFCQIAHICCCKTSAPWSPIAQNALKQLATVWKHWFVGLILNRHYNSWRGRLEKDNRALARTPWARQVSQLDRPHHALDVTTDFILDLPIRRVPATTKEQECRYMNNSNYDLPTEWEQFNKHQAKHPCLWSTLRILGWNWADESIFALWLKHPEWFDNSSGTSLSAAAHLLKPLGFHISNIRYGETPDICWTLKNKQGHFEIKPIHHCPASDKHSCFVIYKLPRARNLSEETVTAKPRSSITTEKAPRFFGSAKY